MKAPHIRAPHQAFTDWLEAQFDQMKQVGIENCLSEQIR